MHGSLDREIGGIGVLGVLAADPPFDDGDQIGRVAPALLCVVN